MFQKELDFKYSDRSSVHLSFTLTNNLFQYYKDHGGDLTNIYEILCDAKSFLALFDTDVKFTRYWYFYQSSAYLSDYREKNDCLRITWDPETRLIKFEEMAGIV